MNKYGCRHCGKRFSKYSDLEDHLTNHPNVCRTCKRSFRKRSTLLVHKCKVAEFLCESCQRTFCTEKQLKRHLRATTCRQSLPPEPKRQKMTPLLPPVEEDPVEPPPPIQGSDLKDVLREHGYSIRSHVTWGPVQTRYNHRLTSLDTNALDLPRIFHEQTTAFKVNVSYGFILKNKTTGPFKYYHSSCNCCGRYLEEPSLVTNAETFETFLERI